MAKKSQLHQLLAVLAAAKGVANQGTTDITTLFSKKGHRFEGGHDKKTHFEEGDLNLDTEERVEVDTTVEEELDKWFTLLTPYLDTQFKVDIGNQEAKADVVIDDKIVAKDVPVDTLRILEARIKEWSQMLTTIPTLATGVVWRKDENQRGGILVANKARRTSNKEIRYPLELSPATQYHPAQVVMESKAVPIAELTGYSFSGKISSIAKGEMESRLNSLSWAVKNARSKANSTEVDNSLSIAKGIGNYLLKGE